MFELVNDEAPLRHKWKPSFKTWLFSSAIALAILFLASWYDPALRDDAPYWAFAIPLIIAGGFIGILLAQTGFYEVETPLKDQSGWQRFFTLLIYRKHSPRWGDVVFFTGCTFIYIAVFAFFFGIPEGVLPFAIAVVVNL